MWHCLPPHHYGNRHCCLLPCHFSDTQQLAKRGTSGKYASNRGKATGNTQSAQKKDEKAAQHKHQCNDSNRVVAVMVTAMAVATTAIMVAVAKAKTTAITAMVRGKDNNQLKATVEETAAARTK
jgi:hypothetical protein